MEVILILVDYVINKQTNNHHRPRSAFASASTTATSTTGDADFGPVVRPWSPTTAATWRTANRRDAYIVGRGAAEQRNPSDR